MFQVKFADIGEGIHEGVIFKVYVSENQEIEEGDPLMAIETDKVTAEIPSPVSGMVTKVSGRAGDKIHVGELIALIDDATGEVKSNMEVDEMDMGIEETGQKSTETVEEQGSTSVVGEIEVSSEVIPASEESHVVQEIINKENRVLATPVARKMAKDLGIDIQSVEGTGPAGRVLKSDIQKAHKLKIDNTKLSTSGHGDAPKVQSIDRLEEKELEERLIRRPMSTIRKTISENMTKSKYTIPHTVVMDEVDVTDLVAYRNQTKDMASEDGVKLTYLAFVVLAVTKALKKYEILNASLDERTEEILIKKFYNIGIAVDTPQGLMVPVIKDANRLSVFEIATRIQDLSQRSRSKTLHMDELTQGTFSITNYGAFGSSYGVPIIRYPEAAVLGIGAIKKKPVVYNDEITIREIMPLSMSFDHRIMDGADAGRFIKYLKELLESPNRLLLS